MKIFWIECYNPMGRIKTCHGNIQEAISKNGFWLKVKAGATFKPEEYSSILRI